MRQLISPRGVTRDSAFAASRSPDLLTLPRTFLMVILLAAFALSPQSSSASDFGVPLPDGAGIGIRIPLGDERSTSLDNEVQLFMLMGRHKLVRMESPVHGRFVRVRIGALKFKKYNNFNRRRHSRRNAIHGARRNRTDGMTAGRPDRLNRVTHSGRNKVIASARPAATGSTKQGTRPTSARRAYAQSVSIYDALRRSYLRVKNKRSGKAKRIHAKMMQAYKLALRLRSIPGVRQ